MRTAAGPLTAVPRPGTPRPCGCGSPPAGRGADRRDQRAPGQVRSAKREARVRSGGERPAGRVRQAQVELEGGGMTGLGNLTLQAAVLKVLADEVAARLAVVKADAEVAFQAAGSSQAPATAGRHEGRNGLLRGRATGVSASVTDEAAFLAWVLEHYPDEIVRPSSASAQEEAPGLREPRPVRSTRRRGRSSPASRCGTRSPTSPSGSGPAGRRCSRRMAGGGPAGIEVVRPRAIEGAA